MITDEGILSLLEAKFPGGDVRGHLDTYSVVVAESEDAPQFAMVISLDRYPSDAIYLNDIIAGYEGRVAVLLHGIDNRHTLTLADLEVLVDKAIVGSKYMLDLENAK